MGKTRDTGYLQNIIKYDNNDNIGIGMEPTVKLDVAGSGKFSGDMTVVNIPNATTDTDKFLVSDAGVVKYRTGAQLLSDLGITPGVANDVQNLVKAGVAINKGQAVYVTGADGTNIIVGLASNTSEATSSKTLGLLNATVAVNGFADVVQIGRLSGLNTIGATAGDPVWLGTNGNLIYGLVNKPYAPAHLVFLGIVTRVNSNNGEIFVNVQNGFELNEIHDVDLKTTVPINGDVLGFNGTLWVNKTIAGWLGYTPVTNARTLSINGTALDLTANRSWSVGTVTSLGLDLGNAGTDLSIANSPITSSGNITLNIPTASASNRGALSSTDWSTFNNKQNTITLTITGSSGSSSLVGSTLNIPAYTLSGLGGQPLATNLTSLSGLNYASTSFVKMTASGTFSLDTNIYYLASNPSGFTSNTGTVTSVAALTLGTTGTDLSSTVANGTTAPVITLNVPTASSTNRGALSSADWTTFNSKANASGTTNYVSKFTGATTLGNSLIYDNGTNVGLGTTTPSQKLTVGDGTGTGNQYIRVNSSASDIYIGQSGGTIFGLSANSAQLILADAVSYPLGIGTISAQPFILGTQNAERMRITSSGNLLLGQTSDFGYLLQVNGTSYFQGATLFNSSVTAGAFLTNGASGAAGQEAIRINNDNGYIGFFNSANNTRSGYIQGNTTDLTITTSPSTPLIFGTANAERMRISASGNVGIGTTSPDYPLEIENTNQTSIVYQRTGVSAKKWGFISDNGATYWSNITDDILPLTLQNGGNVGIGTTSPSQKLEVSGVIESPYLEYKPVVFYDFNSNTTGDWQKYNATLSTPSKSITRYTSIGADSSISRSFNFSGGQNQIIRIHYKVISGTPGTGEIFYANSQHGYSGSYFKGLELINDGNWHTLVLDMSQLSSGGTDWIDYNVLDIRFDLTNNVGVVIDLDWISIGGNGYGTQYFENDVAFMNGNVGIGTTSPAWKLDVSGLGRFRDANTYEGAFIEGTNGVSYFGSLATDAISLYSSGVSRVYINSSGNVGIGTTSPSYKTVIHSSSVDTDVLCVSNDQINADSAQHFVGISLQDQYSNGSGNVSAIRSYSNLYAQWGSTLTFSTTGTGGNGVLERMRINASGNVGIGTTSPSASLDVVSESNANGINIRTRINNDFGFLNFKSYNGSETLSEIYINRTSINVGDLIFTTNNGSSPSERMRILANGNVGIGTTDIPYGNLALKSNSATTYDGFNVFASSNNKFVAVNHTGTVGVIETESAGAGNSDLTIRTAGSERMRITSGGNIGIGTTSPGSKLSLYDTSDLWINISKGSSFVNIGVDTTGTFYNTNSNHRFLYNSGSNEALRITSNGNVGIGTTSPSYPLEVNGSINVYPNNFFRYDGDTGIIGSATSIGGASNQLGIRASNDILFATNGANERMRITSSGNVGIGTTSPGANLTVVRNANNASYITTFSNTNAGASAATVSEWKVNGYSSFVIGKSNSDGRVEIAQIGNYNIDFINNGINVMSIDTNQNVMVNGTTAEACAQLEIKSETKGFLPPRMSDADRDNISSPVEGLMIYNTTQKTINFYDGTTWQRVAVV